LKVSHKEQHSVVFYEHKDLVEMPFTLRSVH